MGWYGTPDDVIQHFDIDKSVIQKVKERWRESAKNEPWKETAGRRPGGLESGGDSGAEEAVEA
jgi:transposase